MLDHIAVPHDISQSRILIVDDSPVNLRLLSRALERQGFQRLETAENGKEALALTESFRPDLVVLDLLMPEMDGYEYCQHVRARPEWNTMAIVVQTAVEERVSKMRVLSLGANDFLSKPVDTDELLLRVRLHLERTLLQRQLREYREYLKSEAESVSAMQKSLMPNAHLLESLAQTHQLRFGIHFEPSRISGGDCLGCRPLSDTRAAFYLFDFADRGISAALNVFRLHALIHEHNALASDPAALLATLNTELCQMLRPEQHASIFFGVIDKLTHTLNYAQAGFPDAILMPASRETLHAERAEMLPSAISAALGVDRRTEFTTHSRRMGPGDLLLLQCNTFISSPSANGACLDGPAYARRIHEALEAEYKRAAAVNPPFIAIEQSLSMLKEHLAGNAPDDDCTLLALYRMES